MSFDAGIAAAAAEAARTVPDGATVGLGSGRAATAVVRELGRRASSGLRVRGVATSEQIRRVAVEAGVELADAASVDSLEAAFDGADQVDARGNMVKGRGGALLREKVAIGMAARAVIIADASKFAERLSIPVPVEVHPAAGPLVARRVSEMGASPSARLDARGYPAFTESGNTLLDCDFGEIADPAGLEAALAAVPGVMESGLFARRHGTVYRALEGGRFEAAAR